VSQSGKKKMPASLCEMLIFGNTVKLQSFEVVGAIFTSLNHPKCEWNLHFWWFWIVKIAPTTGIWVQKDKKRNIESANVFENTMYSNYPCSSYQGLTVYIFKSIVLEATRLKAKSGPTYVGPYLCSSLFCNFTKVSWTEWFISFSKRIRCFTAILNTAQN